MAGTVVTYNDVEMRNVETVSWQEAVHMDDSNTDEIYVLIRARFKGMVHPGLTGNAGISYTGNNENAAVGYTQIAARLSQPRATLSISWGPDNVLTVVGNNLASPQRDVNNGPKPKVVNIDNVAGYRVIMVEWEVEVAIPRCTGNTLGDPAAVARVLGNPEVISNRWSATETKDENFYSKIEYQGTMVVRRITQNADLFRALVVPPLLPGFQREHLVFYSTPDGLHLQYTVVDKQKFAAPPPPATSWDCKYTVETNNGASIFSTVQVSLTGPPGTDQRQLLVASLQVVEARLGNLRQPPVPVDPNNGNKPPRSVIVRQATVIEDVANNKVTAVVRAQEIPNQAGIAAALQLPLESVGTPLAGVAGYNPKQWPVPSLYNSTVGPFAFKLANPCQNQIPSLARGQQTFQPPIVSPSYSQPTGYGSPTIVSTQISQLPTDTPAQISAEQRKHQYLTVEIYNRYETTTGKVQQPIAKSNPAANNAQAPTSSFSTVHSPVCRRIFRMRAERAFTNVQLPPLEETRKDINGISETLLSYQVVPIAPQLMPDGKNYVYAAEIELVYGLERCPSPNELYIAGASPMDMTTGYLTALPGSALTDKTIQGGQGGTT